jgi:hypothetical protein
MPEPTEQAAVTEEEEVSPEQAEMSEAFSEIVQELEKPGEKAPEKEPEKKAEEEVKPEEEKKAPDEEEGKPKEEEPKPEEEADIQTKRGKELLEQEEADKAERQRAETARKASLEAAKRAAETVVIPPLSVDKATELVNLIPKERLPESIEFDGSNILLSEYTKDNPEISIIAGLMAEEYLINTLDKGVLLTAHQVQEMLAKQEKAVSDQIFGVAVSVEVQNLGYTGVDIVSLVKDPKFNEWGEGLKGDEIKALFRSGNPRDYALAIDRYLKDTGQAKAKPKAEDLDKKNKEETDEHVSLHSSTLRGVQKKTGDEPKAGETYGELFRAAARELEKEG